MPKDKETKKRPKPEDISLGSGMAESAKNAKIERNKRNAEALGEAMEALQIQQVNEDKKYNNQYGRGGKK